MHSLRLLFMILFQISGLCYLSIFTWISLRIQEYVPGMSYFMGFYQKYEKNPERQAAVTVVASSPETFDMKVKIPEVVVI